MIQIMKKHNFLQWTLLHYKMEKKPNNTNLTKLLNNNTIVYINKTNLNNSHKVKIFLENSSKYEVSSYLRKMWEIHVMI